MSALRARALLRLDERSSELAPAGRIVGVSIEERLELSSLRFCSSRQRSPASRMRRTVSSCRASIASRSRPTHSGEIGRSSPEVAGRVGHGRLLWVSCECYSADRSAAAESERTPGRSGQAAETRWLLPGDALDVGRAEAGSRVCDHDGSVRLPMSRDSSMAKSFGRRRRLDG